MFQNNASCTDIGNFIQLVIYREEKILKSASTNSQKGAARKFITRAKYNPDTHRPLIFQTLTIFVLIEIKA